MSSKLVGSGHLKQTISQGEVPKIVIPNERSTPAQDLTDDLIAELGDLGGDQDKNSVELLDDNLERDNWNPFETPRSNILKEPLEEDFQQSDVEKSGSQQSDQQSFADEKEILEKLEFVCQDQLRTKNSTRLDSEGGADTQTYWEQLSNGTNTVGSESPGREGYLYAGQQNLRNKQLDKLIKYAPAVELITEEEDTDNSFRFSQVWHDLAARVSKHLLHDVFKTAKEYNIDSSNYKRMGIVLRKREKLIYVLARMRSSRKVLLKRFLDQLRKLSSSEQASPIQLKPESIMQAKNAKGRESLKTAPAKNIKLGR